MLKQLKKDLYEAVSSIPMKLQDTPNYEEDLPQILFHLNNYNVGVMQNAKIEAASFVFDIFSDYSGEDEIIDMQEKITNAVNELSNNKEYIMGWTLREFRIIDDTSKGPVKKHGILQYYFQLAYSIGGRRRG